VSYSYLVTASNNTGESAPSAEVNGVPGLRAWARATAFPGGAGALAVNGRGDRVLAWPVQSANGWELWGRDRNAARATLGEGLSVSAFPRYVPV
jgi:hypothetical protein